MNHFSLVLFPDICHSQYLIASSHYLHAAYNQVLKVANACEWGQLFPWLVDEGLDMRHFLGTTNLTSTSGLKVRPHIPHGWKSDGSCTSYSIGREECIPWTRENCVAHTPGSRVPCSQAPPSFIVLRYDKWQLGMGLGMKLCCDSSYAS